MKQLKILFLFIISTTFVSCSLDEDFVKNQKSISLQDIKANHINYTDFNRKTQFVKNKPNFDNMISHNIMEKASVDTTDYVIYTDRITELAYNDYTSYTMLLKTPNTSKNVYYNIIFEVQNQNTTVFIVKYTKFNSGILEGNITSFRASEDFTGGGPDLLQKYIDDFENGGAAGSIGTTTSTGSAGITWTGLGASPVYPSNCNGTVSTTYVLEPHACYSLNHMPGQSCEYLNPSYQFYDPNKGPYYRLVPYYTCIPNSSGSNSNPPNNSGSTSGGNTSPDDITGAITGMIQPEECIGKLIGDLNGDCMLSQYEICILNGTPADVCECIEQGGNIVDCANENDCKNLSDMLDSQGRNLNFYINELVIKHQQSVVNEVSYSFKKTIVEQDPIVYGYSHEYKEGSPISVLINLRGPWHSAIHLHPKADGAAESIFSWGDISLLKDLYDSSFPRFKVNNDISLILVAPDPQNNNNYNVYALTVNNINNLTAALNAELNSSRWNSITDEKKKLKDLNEDCGNNYKKNKNNLERFFLDYYNNYGINLYKLINNQWNKLEPSNTSIGVTHKPCN